ncbi:HlyD family secretion protein [Reyranella sp.]|uniref:efflux RND transporter periplasmic adaptor subunit n=1 Tax=Reyranella sp. TaxID=1929291 RepID=UPI002625A8FC|nr:HlyD family secretion protein [Reyranella sp.]HQS18940.1 HlyD family secretion protein [Reyranella sp.]HQT12291.1 HlyD family secretion protein [Reyranella sp.]
MSARVAHLVRIAVTLVVVAVAVGLSWAMWREYMGTPWTRDGVVRSYVVTMAPQVPGEIVSVAARDNQFVRKGDVLVTIDPTNYRIAVELAEAAVKQAEVNAQNANVQSDRRARLSAEAVSKEEQQNFATRALANQAQYQQAVANRQQAKVNLARTQIRSPVDGWVTNLLVQLGDYANTGVNVLSVVDGNSFWVDAYFEEPQLARIREGAPVRMKLMGYDELMLGEVESVARGINVGNARPDQLGLAIVNPIFTWVRLAQRVPVRVRLSHVPEGVRLVAGLTVTVEVGEVPPDRHQRP